LASILHYFVSGSFHFEPGIHHVLFQFISQNTERIFLICKRVGTRNL
jgi:hypothetical protein